MKLILSPKDNLNKIELENVQTFCLEGETLCVIFEDGRTRNYPLYHLWYYESHVDNHRTAPTKNDPYAKDGEKLISMGGSIWKETPDGRMVPVDIEEV